jgi:seryl-tRNA synthetase
MATFTVKFNHALPEMAREEIQKQITFISEHIRATRFSEAGKRLEFEAPPSLGPALCPQVAELAHRLGDALGDLERKVIFRSSAFDNVAFSNDSSLAGVRMLGPGQAAISELPLALLRYFDRVFEGFGSGWNAATVLVPTLIPASVLARCDYFRAFPHSVTFATHLQPNAEIIDQFRARHDTATTLDSEVLSDMATPTACLSPAVCYHIYHLHQGDRLPNAGRAYGVCGRCFRFENKNMVSLNRLWEFTMREVVFLGARDTVFEHRSKSIEMMCEFLEQHRLAGEIRTASDPFFVAPDTVSKTCFQLSSDSKFEISLRLPDGERIAVGSHNYHSDFFGRAFETRLEGSGFCHSACVAFGLERWICAFLAQHGSAIQNWPTIVRKAPEFRRFT